MVGGEPIRKFHSWEEVERFFLPGSFKEHALGYSDPEALWDLILEERAQLTQDPHLHNS